MIQQFSHSTKMWADFPALVPGVVLVIGITPDADTTRHVNAFGAAASKRLAGSSEAELPEIQAWRKAFAQMGHKPTQYRCASESLLRRYRKEGSLPRLHPLVDLCNAASTAFAIPIAAFDADRIAGHMRVRHANGDETYQGFSGDPERPEPGEVVFADAAGQAHARRWTHRQSRTSAVSSGTTTALLVAEGLHSTAAADIPALQAALIDAIAATWQTKPARAVLSQAAPVFYIEHHRSA